MRAVRLGEGKEGGEEVKREGRMERTYMYMCIYTIYVKMNALFDKKRATLLWFASGFVREAYCGAFCQTRHNSAKSAEFSQEKCRNPWKSVKSAVHTEG